MIITKLQIVPRLVVASLLVATLGLHAYAVDLTWTGATSNLIFDNGSATGNWTPSVPTGVQGSGENWIFPDATTLGSGSVLPSFDSGGVLSVGGNSLGGITFAVGAPAYVFTQTDPANTLNLAGTSNTNSSTDRGIITNNSTSTQTFNMDVTSSRSTIDAKSGDIVFGAGHTFTTGGQAGVASTSNTNANTLSTIFQGDHNIYLNSNVVQTLTGTTTDILGTSGQRGQILYRGASTTAENAGALVLGDLGTYGGRITNDSVNGGVIRATHNNSFGAPGGISQNGTVIGSGTTGATSNGAVEIDGTVGGLTIPESFRLGMRTAANTKTHLRNVAGNNTITGFVSLNTPTTVGSTSNSAHIESTVGKITFTGSISNDRPNNTSFLYFKGAGAIDLGGVDGLYASFDTNTSILNVDKSGTGTVTTLAGTINGYSGTTTIHEGSFIVNGTHATTTTPVPGPATAGAYTVETMGTLGGKGSIVSAVNLSGKIAPGDVSEVGTFTVNGLTTTSGILDFHLNATNHTAGSTFNDLLVINNDGLLDLSGGATLNVTGIGGNLTTGDYDLIHFGGTTTPAGTAANIALGAIPLGAGLAASIVIDSDSVNLHVAVGGVPGDYNGDGKVNAADYVVWRKDPGNHGNAGGYTTWRANFGTGGPGSGSGLESNSSSVPEPARATLVVFGILIACLLYVPNRCGRSQHCRGNS